MPAVLAFLIGASIGSFLNVVIDRLPAGRSLVRPRSSCDTCQTVLSNTDNIPILSYLFLRGRCRYCDAGIPVRVLLVEIATAGLFLALYFQFGFGARFGVMAGATAVLIAVALIDLDHQLILNKITFPAAIVVLALSPFWPELGFNPVVLRRRRSPGGLPQFAPDRPRRVRLLRRHRHHPARWYGLGRCEAGVRAGRVPGVPHRRARPVAGVGLGRRAGRLAARLPKMGAKGPHPYGVILTTGALVMVFAQEEAISWYYDATASVGGVLV